MFSRNCPSCQKVLTYSCKAKLNRATSSNSSCVDCTNKRLRCGKEVPIDIRKKISNRTRQAMWREDVRLRYIQSLGSRDLSLLQSQSYKRNLSRVMKSKSWLVGRSGVDHPCFNRVQTQVERCKRRRLAIERLKQCGTIRASNRSACIYLDGINRKYSPTIYFRHARNSSDGEYECCGYFADGYDCKKNIWFEYDERHHETPKRKHKDLERSQTIIGELGCRFIRYSETYNIMYEVTIDGLHKKIATLDEVILS